MNSERVREIIKDSLWTEPFGVDDAVPDGCEVVDVIFFKVGFDKAKTEAYADELRSIVAEDVDNVDMWEAGPSYIHIGAWMGDQQDALILIGLGHVAGIWKCETPRSTGFADEKQVKELAGAGFVYAMGFQRST